MPSASARGPDPVTGQIVAALYQLVDELSAYFDAVAATFDLTPTQALALRHLDEPRTMRHLAELLRCEASNATAVVDRLERRGLVARHAVAGDRRVREVTLTEEGRRLFGRLTAQLFTAVPAVAGLTEADRRTLRDLLTTVTATIEAGKRPTDAG